MKAIAIDTATERANIVLFEHGQCIAVRELTGGFMHARTLVSAIEELVSDPKELGFVAVGVGPGSYTGIRVGVSCAKAISFARNIPLVALNSLAAFCPSPDLEGPFLSAIDARSGGVYVMRGVVHAGTVSFTGDAEVVSFERFVSEFTSVHYLVTPSFLPLKERLDDAGVSYSTQILERYPSSAMQIAQAERAMAEKRSVLDGSVQICYLRGPVG